MKTNVLMCVVMLMAAGLVHAVPVNLAVTDDAFINAGAPDDNYGSGINFTVSRASDGSLNRKGYLKFDLSEIQGMDVADIISATLKLEFYNGYSNSGAVEKVTGSWNEDTITWNNAPATAGLGIGWTMDSTVGKTEVDLTDLVKSWVDGTNANNGIMLRNYGGGGYIMTNFWTKEGTASYPDQGISPYIEVSIVPEPMTLGLLGAGLVFIRRRK